jgi:hypothetical protein
MLRVCPVDGSKSSFLVCDESNKQVTVLDQSVCAHHSVTTPAAVSSPSPASSRRRPLAPKTFPFDSVFSQDSSMVRIFRKVTRQVQGRFVVRLQHYISRLFLSFLTGVIIRRKKDEYITIAMLRPSQSTCTRCDRTVNHRGWVPAASRCCP